MNSNTLKLKQFLEKNNVYDEYIHNISSLKLGGALAVDNKYKSISQFFERVSPKSFILNAFYHHLTHNPKLWAKLSIEWLKTLNNGT